MPRSAPSSGAHRKPLLQLLLDLDAESLAEVEFQGGERERLVEWLKAVRALKKRCAELDKAIP